MSVRLWSSSWQGEAIEIYLRSSYDGLNYLGWTPPGESSSDDSLEARDFLSQAIELLESYFFSPRDFSLKKLPKLDICGTDFQRKVWKLVGSIPYAQTCTYKSIAQSLNAPNSSRAIGNAVGRNPICLFIPCHRVVAVNKVGGYIGGSQLKSKLLEHEKRSSLCFA